MPPTSRDLGDFQTPPGLVDQVVDLLDRLEIPRTRVLEPTCGRGHFLSALLATKIRPSEIVGFELQAEHLAVARASVDSGIASLGQGDFFEVELRTIEWRESGPLLVIGNPPWVTSAELGRLGSTRGPVRRSLAGMSGLDSLTGASNFDLAEAVWLKLLNEIDEPGATIALLCKTLTARKIVRAINARGYRVASALICRIDARKWFGAAVDACLLMVTLGEPPKALRVPVFSSLNAREPEREIGVIDGMVVSDLGLFDETSFAFGNFARTWRQGVKHDAKAVMELRFYDGELRNGFGELVEIEPDYHFPLMKGADLARNTIRTENRVIVTQLRVGDDTKPLETLAPKLWKYLGQHAGVFESRKSRIYNGQPPFSMFGIGSYTFEPHKVAVPGLHKGVPFQAIRPVDNRPVVLDDTCYFLPCSNAADARTTARLLNGDMAQKLIAALSFADAKRQITKSVLQRIDLTRLVEAETSAPLAAASPVE